MKRKTKVLAYYLPAFHRIKENDEWYGENFTEWDNTKKAVPLFKNHNQPRIPMDYYDLSNIDTVKWQNSIARQHGIDGFVYYHYWFNPDGRMVLERPAEEMNSKLRVEEKIDYCFCWANQEWRKTWHEGRGTTSELLIEQIYGCEEDWDAHLEYLLKFFSDEKYIKVNNAPMFLILRPEDIPNYEEMYAYWNSWAKKKGFNGIYFVRMRNSHRVDKLSIKCNAIVDFEPNYTINTSYTVALKHFWRLKTFLFWHLSRWEFYPNLIKNKVNYVAFNRTMKEKTNRNIKETYYLSCFVDWDNSPRKGKRGTIFTKSSPKEFEKEFDYYYSESLKNGNDYLFCFAWNEWGEGGYLEPDTKYGYSKLEAVKRVKEKYEE